MEAHRKYTPFSFHRFTEHLNKTIGRPVSSMKDFERGLRQAEDEQAQRLGYDQKFRAVDPRDKEALGVTDDGLEKTERVHRAMGSEWAQPKKKIIHG